MAQCEWCGDETSPGDLTSKEIGGAFHLFCSADHAHDYEEQGADKAPCKIYEKVMEDEVVSEEEASRAGKILAAHEHTPAPSAPRRRGPAKRKPKAPHA
jgi:hypothetical protein